jgi:hypothetical protein
MRYSSISICIRPASGSYPCLCPCQCPSVPRDMRLAVETSDCLMLAPAPPTRNPPGIVRRASRRRLPKFAQVHKVLTSCLAPRMRLAPNTDPARNSSTQSYQASTSVPGGTESSVPVRRSGASPASASAPNLLHSASVRTSRPMHSVARPRRQPQRPTSSTVCATRRPLLRGTASLLQRNERTEGVVVALTTTYYTSTTPLRTPPSYARSRARP